MNETISLREYFESKFVAVRDAAGVFAAGLERRLTELNKLREDVVKDRSEFVRLETYLTTEKERALWRETTNQRITVIETRSVTWTAALGVFFVILQILLAVLFYYISHKSS